MIFFVLTAIAFGIFAPFIETTSDRWPLHVKRRIRRLRNIELVYDVDVFIGDVAVLP